MKHPVRDRLLMLLYVLVSLCVAAALIAVVFGRITPDMLSGAVAQLRAFPERGVKMAMLVTAVVLVVLGLSLLDAMFPPKKKRSSNFAIQRNENGTVRISLKTIDALVQKCLAQHSELKVVSSALFSDEETVRVDVHIALLSDISMPLAISALQKQITKYVEACSGVNVCEVRVFVDGAMNGAEKATQSKYALPASLLVGEIAEEEEISDAEADAPAVQEEALNEEPAAQEEAPMSEEASVEQEENEQEIPAEEVSVQEEAQEPAQEFEAPALEDIPQETAEPQKKKIFGFFSKK